MSSDVKELATEETIVEIASAFVRFDLISS